MPDSDKNYDVGYGKPPKPNQFKKGQSGNPKGRPKGSLNIATALERELNQRVVIKEHGQSRTITKFEAVFKQLANKAASGDGKAIQILVSLLNLSEGGSLKEFPPIPTQDADLAVMASFMNRMKPRPSAASEEKSDAPQS